MTIRELAVVIKAHLQGEGFKRAQVAIGGVKTQLEKVVQGSNVSGAAMTIAQGRALKFGAGLSAAMSAAEGLGGKLKVVDEALKKQVPAFQAVGELVNQYRLKIGLATAAMGAFVGFGIKGAAGLEQAQRQVLALVGGNKDAYDQLSGSIQQVIKDSQRYYGESQLLEQIQPALRLDLDTSFVSKALPVVAKIAAVTGQSVESIFEGLSGSIASGEISSLASMRRQILSAKQVAALEQQIGSKTMSDLSVQERQRIILNALVQRGTTLEGQYQDIISTNVSEWQRLKNTVGDFFELVGGPFLKPLSMGLRAISSGIGAVVDQFPILAQLTGIVAAVGASLGVAVLGFGAWATSIGAAQRALIALHKTPFAPIAQLMLNPIKNLIPALGMLSKGLISFATGPVGLTIAGITALVAAFLDLKSGLEGGESHLAGWIAGFLNFFGVSITAQDILNGLKVAVEAVQKAFSIAGEGIRTALGWIGTGIQAVAGAIGPVLGGIGEFAKLLKELFALDFDAFFSRLTGWLGGSEVAARALAVPVAALSILIGTTLAAALAKGSLALLKFGARIALVAGGAIVKLIAGLGLLAGQAIVGLISSLSAATASVIAFSAALWANPITWIVAGVAALIAGIVLLARNWDKVRAAAVGAWKWISKVWGDAADWIMAKWKPVGDFFAGLWNGISGFFGWLFGGGKAGDAKAAGAEVVGQVAKGIEGAKGQVEGAMEKTGEAAMGYLPQSPAKRGPLKGLPRAGHEILAQVGAGLDRAGRALEAPLSRAATTIQGALTPELAQGSPTRPKGGESIFQTIGATLQGLLPTGLLQGLQGAMSVQPALVPALAGAGGQRIISAPITYSPTYNLGGGGKIENMKTIMKAIEERDKRFLEVVDQHLVEVLSGSADPLPADAGPRGM